MNKEKFFDAFRDISPQYIDSAAPRNGRCGAIAAPKTKLWRTLAVAACVALLTAGMLAALPFMLGGNEQPPVVEPPVTDGETGIEDITTQPTVPSEVPFWLGAARVPYVIAEIINVDSQSTHHINNAKTTAVNCKVLFAHSAEYYFQLNQAQQPDGAKSLYDISEFYFSDNVAFEIESGEIVMFQVKQNRSANEYYYYPHIYNATSEFFEIKNNRLVLTDDDINTATFRVIGELNEAVEDRFIYSKDLKPIKNESSIEEIKHFFTTVEETADETQKRIVEMWEAGIPT